LGISFFIFQVVIMKALRCIILLLLLANIVLRLLHKSLHPIKSRMLSLVWQMIWAKVILVVMVQKIK
jgi:hypothetical protein